MIEALKFGQFLRYANWDAFVGEDPAMIPGSLIDYKTQTSECYSP